MNVLTISLRFEFAIWNRFTVLLIEIACIGIRSSRNLNFGIGGSARSAHNNYKNNTIPDHSE